MEERKIGGEGKRDKKGIKVNPKREKDNRRGEERGEKEDAKIKNKRVKKRRGEERGEKGNVKIKHKRETDHGRGEKER